MKKLATVIAAIALVGTSAFAADMAVKAPPPAAAPVPTWTGFYGGIQFGGGWSDPTVNYSPNDPITALILSGTTFGPLATSYRISQSGLVGGLEAGYNWQAGSNWLLGLEADFSLSSISGQASPVSATPNDPDTTSQAISAQQKTDWYGTVRGRLGWLATPNLLLFGSGGFAYGRVSDNANYTVFAPTSFVLTVNSPTSSVVCFTNLPCLTGGSSEVRTGWTAGGGAEWLLDQHWSAKIEYQFVDLGTQTIAIKANLFAGTQPSFNASFRDQFNVVRLGLNYRFW